MKIFVTGATGFIGSRVVKELLAAGHQVVGMTRSESGARTLKAAGAEAHLATLEDLESIKAGVRKADAVVHCAFDHDFSNFVANCEKDRRVIEAMGEALIGTKKPIVITSGTGIGGNGPGKLATEDSFDKTHPNPRIASELAGQAIAAKGVNVSVMRLPQVHDPLKAGLISPLADIAKDKKSSAYVGAGQNRWPAAHVNDVAQLYRLVIEKAEPNSVYNAVAEEGITAKEIAEVLGEGLKLPVKSLTPDEAKEHFGWMGIFVGLDMSASSESTRKRTGWKPTGPGMIEDLKKFEWAK